MSILGNIFSPKALLPFLPMIVTEFGVEVKGKDANETGADDAFGNVLISIAPAITAWQSGNENALKKTLKATYIALGNYLGYPPPEN